MRLVVLCQTVPKHKNITGMFGESQSSYLYILKLFVIAQVWICVRCAVDERPVLCPPLPPLPGLKDTGQGKSLVDERSVLTPLPGLKDTEQGKSLVDEWSVLQPRPGL